MKMTKKRASIFGLAATTIISLAGFSSCAPRQPRVYGPAPEDDRYEEEEGTGVSSDQEESAVSSDREETAGSSDQAQTNDTKEE